MERKFIVLGRSNYGLAPKVAHKGDVCAIILRARLPFILGKVDTNSENNYYKVVGSATVKSEARSPQTGAARMLGETYDNMGRQDTHDWVRLDLPTEDIFLC